MRWLPLLLVVCVLLAGCADRDPAPDPSNEERIVGTLITPDPTSHHASPAEPDTEPEPLPTPDTTARDTPLSTESTADPQPSETPPHVLQETRDQFDSTPDTSDLTNATPTATADE